MEQLFFVGSYAEAEQPGVYVCSFDPNTGEVVLKRSYEGLRNPTFLAVDAVGKRLYALSEVSSAEGAKHGAVAAFEMKSSDELNLLNIQETVPATTCHVVLDHTRQCLMVASYHGGMIGLSPIGQDGRVGPSADVHRHQGASIHPAQDRPRAHSVTVDPNNRFAVVCDLGTDSIVTYRLDIGANKLLCVFSVQVAPGSGPRHFAFHPSRSYGYVINELNSTITALAYDEEHGTLKEFQTVSTLPEGYQADNACADLHLSPDGSYLYGSNRGHDSIVVFRIQENGELSLVEHISAAGRHPRNFALTPDGAFLLVANRDTNNVVVFKRDAANGRLEPLPHSLTISKPVCIKFL